MTLDHLIEPDLGGYEKPSIKSIFDLLPTYESPIKDMDIFSNDVIKMAHEMAVEPPSAIQRRMIIDKLSEQNELLSKQHAQDKEQIELQKQEIDLLKKTLETLGILPNMDTNLDKIANKQDITDYDQKLIVAGKVLLQGNTLIAVDSLEKIAIFLVEKCGIKDLDYRVLEKYRQENGEPFSERYCKDTASNYRQGIKKSPRKTVK